MNSGDARVFESHADVDFAAERFVLLLALSSDGRAAQHFDGQFSSAVCRVVEFEHDGKRADAEDAAELGAFERVAKKGVLFTGSFVSNRRSLQFAAHLFEPRDDAAVQVGCGDDGNSGAPLQICSPLEYRQRLLTT